MGYLKTKITKRYFKQQKQTTSYVILKIIKNLMRHGKFERFYNILIKGTKLAVNRLYRSYNVKLNVIQLLILTINNLSPFCDIKAVRASGRRILVPAPFRFQRKLMIAIKFFVHGVFQCSKTFGYPLHTAIRHELFDLYNERTESISFAYQKKQDFIKNIFYNEKHLRFLKGL